ncbi:hypothetical protein ON010_g18585 [Phytophthora cinnamomi]|nr:hypothetical protein ON010_g18585 [Phytophthora cinnamomi]
MNPACLVMLLETLRLINHNLPLGVGEYDKSRLLQELAVEKEMKTIVNAKRVRDAIIKLFRSTKAEVSEYLANDLTKYAEAIPDVADKDVGAGWLNDN